MDADTTAPLTPILRLTGEQIGSIDPPPEGDWFVDWDEYEEFVPLRVLDAERAARAGDDGLRAAAKAVVDDLARVFQRDDDADPVNIYRMWVELHDHAAALRAALDAPEPAIDREGLE